jgi:ribonuclease HI
MDSQYAMNAVTKWLPGWKREEGLEDQLRQPGGQVRPGPIADTIERNLQTVADQLIQVRSAWRYFDAAALTDTIARQQQASEANSREEGAGQAPAPRIPNGG